MTSLAYFASRPRVNIAGAVVSAVAEAVSWTTAFGDSAYLTPIAFTSFALFMGLLVVGEHTKAEELREAALPRLSLVWGNGQLFDSHHHNGALRIFRLGVMNAGATSINVSVKVSRILPRQSHVFPMLELRQTHADETTSRFIVNKSDEPLVFVDFIYQTVSTREMHTTHTEQGSSKAVRFRKGETYRMELPFAKGRLALPLDHHHYHIWLAIDGDGAGPPLRFVLRREKDGDQYELREAIY